MYQFATGVRSPMFSLSRLFGGSRRQWTSLLPNDIRLCVSDHAGIAERSDSRLRFLRPIDNVNGFQHCAPGARVSFQTDAEECRLRLYWNGLVTRKDTFNSIGSVLVDEFEVDTFRSPFKVGKEGPSALVFRLPVGKKAVGFVWPYGAGLDLVGVDVPAGANVEPAERPRKAIVVAGDSISQGYRSSRSVSSWAFRLAQARGCQLINIANGSEKSLSAHGKSLAGLLNVEAVIYAIGFNNFAAQSDVSAFRDEVAGWIANARFAQPSAGIHVGMFRALKTGADYKGGVELSAYRSAIQAAVANSGDPKTFYFDGNAAIGANRKLFTDGVHLSDLGSAQLAEYLRSVF